MATTLKRRSPTVGLDSEKRAKLTENSEENLEDGFDLARLHCLGMNMAESSDRKMFSSQEEKDLRRERGDLLLKLFKEMPCLADSAAARKAEKNQERAAIWEEITSKVNEKYGDKLEVLTVEKVKKLLTYYKKKDDGSYDNIKSHYNTSSSGLTSTSSCGGSPTSDDVSSDDIEEASTTSSDVKGVNLTIPDALTPNPQLMELLVAMTACSSTSQSTSSAAASNSTAAQQKIHTVSFADNMHVLKKERHDYVVALAEHYMERMCFDNSSRSVAVNTERHNMWIKITQKANEKFASSVGALGVEQAKKLYSNCKRRRRVKMEKSYTVSSEDLSRPMSRDSVFIDNEQEPEGHSSISPPTDSNIFNAELLASIGNMKGLLAGIGRNAEVEDLKRELDEKNKEVELLRSKIVEQANEYSKRLRAVMDIVGAAINAKVAEDLKTYCQ